MPLHYLDTSALAKRYLTEKGSAWVMALFGSEPVAISLLTQIEMASVLARRSREGALTATDRDAIFQLFLSDAADYMVLGLTSRVVREASMLFSATPLLRLRTLDALHLATAQWAFARARRRGIATGSFVAADRGLLEAAGAAGLPIVNPEEVE